MQELAPHEHMNLQLPSYELNSTALVQLSLDEANLRVNNLRLKPGPKFLGAAGEYERSSVLSQSEFREDILAFFRRATQEVHSNILHFIMESYLKPILEDVDEQREKALHKVDSYIQQLENLKTGAFTREDFLEVKNEIMLRRPLLEAQYSNLVKALESAKAQFLNAENRMTPLIPIEENECLNRT